MTHPAAVARPPRGHEPGQIPTITINSPTAGATVTPNFTATGTVSPGSEIVSAAVTDTNIPPNILAQCSPAQQQGPNWSFTFTGVPTGACLLHVKTTDNQASATISLTVQN